mmetsp:Transcript_14514/g.23017  ORF Transcript_14514/g.23017 Transcript_14514/m.23017 type:complete len:183 (+) Transcript_14514:102-650(+)
MFDLGNKKAKVDKFSMCINMINLEARHISSNCLEAIRIVINRNLNKNFKKTQYHLRIRSHPMHIVRNNKVLSKAGADRVSKGMRKSYGKPFALVARLKNNDIIISIRAKSKYKKTIVNILKNVTYKISGIQSIKESEYWGFTKIAKEDYLCYNSINLLKKYGYQTVIKRKGMSLSNVLDNYL